MQVAAFGVAGVALMAGLGSAVAGAPASPELEACFERHAARFGLDPDLLRSIAGVESGMRPEAENTSHLARTGTRDMGLMQINSGWLPTLARYGIDQVQLRDPCTNIEVGAWILSGLLQRLGDSWEAVGAYNAACTELKGADCRRARARYAWRVWRQRQRSSTMTPGGASLRTAGPATPAGVAAVKASGLVAASSLPRTAGPGAGTPHATTDATDATVTHTAEARQP